MNRSSFVLTILISQLFFNCSTYIPYTDKIKSDLELNGIPVDKTQFYFKTQIILERVDRNTKISQNKGNISREQERVREVINFGKRFKKLMAIGKMDNGILSVSFEEGKYIQLNSFSRNYIFGSSEKTVIYDNQVYNITYGSEQLIHINKTDINKYKKKSRKVKGMKVK